MWGWFTSLIDWLKSIFDNVKSIASSLGILFSDLFNKISTLSSNIGGWFSSWFSSLFTNLGNWFTNVGNWFGNLTSKLAEWFGNIPTVILNGIKSIFIPDYEQIKSDFDDMKASIGNSLGLNLHSIEFLNDVTEEKIVDKWNYVSINGVGSVHAKFFDSKYLIWGINNFRPLIRGFVVFLLILYHYKHILTFLGQDPHIISTVKVSSPKGE